MLGVFLTEDPLVVPSGAVAFVAEQLDLDPACLADYGRRPKTAYEHAWEIRELLGYRDFGACEAEVRQFVTARVWASVEGPRALFDRARVHLLKERILLPGISVLVRLVGEVRRAETERVYALLSGRLSDDMHQALEGLLAVPEGKRRSEPERLRTAPAKASGRVLAEELRTFPKLRKAARTMASAMEVLIAAPEATEDRLVSLVEVWKAIEEVVPRERLAAAVETVVEFVPVTDDDAAAE